jgi:hypothetical protein
MTDLKMRMACDRVASECGRLPASVAWTGILAALVAFALPATGVVAHAGQAKASVELFTSQGCSSCPPADKLLGDLARDPSLVTMTLSIDYWDYLGWKDTLALPGHGKRQHAYARTRGDREVYTPQIVINGIAHVAGGDRASIDRTIEETRREPSAMQLPLKLTITGDQLTVEMPAAKDGQASAEVWLLPIINKVSVAIERGENRGHTVTYSNVVRRWVKLGPWNGKAETYNVSIKDFQNGEIDSVAVIVQSGNNTAPGLMLGAASAPLR